MEIINTFTQEIITDNVINNIKKHCNYETSLFKFIDSNIKRLIYFKIFKSINEIENEILNLPLPFLVVKN